MQNMRTTKILTVAVAALLLAGCTSATEPEQAEPVEATDVVEAAEPAALEPLVFDPVDLKALIAEGTEGDRIGVEGITLYDGAQAEWERVTAAWPLPVPADYPFPDTLSPIEGGRYYDVGAGLRTAHAWWDCAADTEVRRALAAGDTDTAQYWSEALVLWWSSDQVPDNYVDPHRYVDGVLTPAANGDFGPLLEQMPHVKCSA